MGKQDGPKPGSSADRQSARTEDRSTMDGVMIVRVTRRISGWKIFSRRVFVMISPVEKLGW